MKYVQKRGNIYYYRRRVPKELHEVSTVKVIYRALSTERGLALKVAAQYSNMFNMMDLARKLKQSVTPYVEELNLLQKEKAVDIYTLYQQSQDVSDKRMTKIKRLLEVIKVLLPNDVSKLNMSTLDAIKSTLSGMPRRNVQKYKVMSLGKVVKVVASIDDRLSTETLNDHLKILNSLVKFAYERDYLAKPYAVSMAKKTSSSREEREALSVSTIMRVIAASKTVELGHSYTLLYLSGLRPSEVYKCKITTVDGVKCFDLTDKSLELKSKSSYRLIPVHSSIDNPEELLESYRSMSSQYINRQFKVEEGTLYSLRHTFATELAASGTEPHIISELLGHTHSGMTLGRYVKGFPVQKLKDAIDTLPSILVSSSLSGI